MALCATSAWAYSFSAVAPSGQTLYYNIVAGNAQVTYQINGVGPNYTNLTGDLVIPASVTYDNITYSVTSIGINAFFYCTGLTTVTIPNSVTSIGSNAFSYCTGMTTVTIGNSVTSIGSRAFGDCTGLTTVTIPNSVTSIGGSAFEDCTGLTSVTIPNSVTSIGVSAFYGCTGLTSVTIPNSVTSIGNNAFYGCTGLTTVTIPNSVTSIGNYAFNGCTGLTSVFFNADSCDAFNIHHPFYSCPNITSFTFGNNVRVIPGLICYNMTGLTSVTIPNSVTSIGMNAFNGCTGLTSVTIPNSVTSIGGSAFRGCTGLTSVFFNVDSCADFNSSDNPFYSCPNITSFTFGNNVRVIPAFICYNMTGLISVTIPNSVTSIGRYAFAGCTGLTSVSIPNSLTSIGEYAFRGCTGLTSVTIPNSVTSIDQSTFSGCTGLTSVTIPNSVTSIGNYAFSGCTGLTSVTIPNSVTSIGQYTFRGCTGLTSVTIPNSVTSIGVAAFYGCSGLTAITSMGTIAPTLGSNDVFYEVPPSIPVYIPCGSSASYQSRWNYFYNFIEPAPPILDIQTVDTTLGIADITTQPTCNSPAVIEATANYGYHFDHWSNGSTANPDTIALIGDSSVTAFFAPNRYSLSVMSGNPDLGTANGGGEYDYLDTVVISTSATEHYHFVRWNDGNTDNPRQVVIECDTTFTAFFAIDTHTVHVETNDIARGMVEATGIEFAYGTPCTVTATAYTGYTFAGWSNGVNVNPYTFAVLSDVELTALFVAEGEQTYTVTVVSDDPTMGTVSGGGQALDGGTVTIRAVGNPGYHFLRWNDNNTDSVRTVEVHGNVTYTAYFASNSTEAIDDVNGSNIKVYAIDGRIVVEGRENRPVRVFNMMGQQMNNNALPTGVYLVKVGTLPARKVVVIR